MGILVRYRGILGGIMRQLLKRNEHGQYSDERYSEIESYVVKMMTDYADKFSDVNTDDLFLILNIVGGFELTKYKLKDKFEPNPVDFKEKIVRILTDYEMKTNEERWSDIKEVYFSYNQGKDRTENFYAKCDIEPSTLRGLIYGSSNISMEQYYKIMSVGKKKEEPKVRKTRKDKVLSKIDKKEYQHKYYLSRTKIKRQIESSMKKWEKKNDS